MQFSYRLLIHFQGFFDDSTKDNECYKLKAYLLHSSKFVLFLLLIPTAFVHQFIPIGVHLGRYFLIGQSALIMKEHINYNHVLFLGVGWLFVVTQYNYPPLTVFGSVRPRAEKNQEAIQFSPLFLQNLLEFSAFHFDLPLPFVVQDFLIRSLIDLSVQLR